jgi:hypothetical protein
MVEILGVILCGITSNGTHVVKRFGGTCCHHPKATRHQRFLHGVITSKKII